jgi:hypothetical protein
MADFSNKSIPTGNRAQPFINTLNQGLQQIAEYKLKDLHKNRLVKSWQDYYGLDTQQARAAAELGINPNELNKILWQYGVGQNGGQSSPGVNSMEALGAGQGMGQQQQPNLMEILGKQQPGQQPGQEQQQLQPQNPEEIAQQIQQIQNQKAAQPKRNPLLPGPGNKPQKPMTPAQLKHRDALHLQVEDLQDLVDTADSMLESLNKGISSGPISALQATWYPTSLDKDSELFAKNAAHLVNLTSKQQKGVQSKYRVQKIEEEKAGLQHSKEVNRDILRKYRANALKKLESLKKDYPDLGIESKEADTINEEGEWFDTKPSPQEAGERSQWTENGVTEEVKNGKWVKV